MWELVPGSTLGEDVGGNLMEPADGSTALELCLYLFVFSIGRRMELKNFTMSWQRPTEKKEITKARQKTKNFLELEYIIASGWRRARESA